MEAQKTNEVTWTDIAAVLDRWTVQIESSIAILKSSTISPRIKPVTKRKKPRKLTKPVVNDAVYVQSLLEVKLLFIRQRKLWLLLRQKVLHSRTNTKAPKEFNYIDFISFTTDNTFSKWLIRKFTRWRKPLCLS